MTRSHSRASSEQGFTLVYMALFITTLLLFTGLAVDSGRAYVVKAQLTKAVDGAALGAARNLNTGNPKAEAQRIFRANFPDGYLGASMVTDPFTDTNFFDVTTDPVTGVNVVTVNATAVVPTTFMQLANLNEVTVTSSGEARRRMVDISLVLDVSSSIGSKWAAVASATQAFINSFDGAHDRMALLLFSNGATVLDAMPSGRGFDKAKLMADVPSSLPGGSTNMVEGLYRGWDQLRTVSLGQQSGMRVIVLFTDGASNGIPGNWTGSAVATAMRTSDFPKNLPDPDNQTHDDPAVTGLSYTNAINSTATSTSSGTVNARNTTSMQTVTPPSPYNYMPPNALFTQHNSSGIQTVFPYALASLNVDGSPQTTARSIILDPSNGKPKASLWNVNNAARNVLEQIADAARNDNGDYKIRIYTIGMGALVQYNLGTRLETPESMLKRIANDKGSNDFKGAPQLEGKYFFAETAAQVSPAFQGIQNQILRLSK